MSDGIDAICNMIWHANPSSATTYYWRLTGVIKKKKKKNQSDERFRIVSVFILEENESSLYFRSEGLMIVK